MHRRPPKSTPPSTPFPSPTLFRSAVAGQHLRQHHGDGLQRLDLLLRVVALGAVLHHEDAEQAPAAHDRHAHQRLVDLLAGLGKVRSEEHTSELQSLMRISYAVSCLNTKKLT